MDNNTIKNIVEDEDYLVNKNSMKKNISFENISKVLNNEDIEKNIKTLIKLKSNNKEFYELQSIIDFCIVIKNKNINLNKFYKKENYFDKRRILKSYFITECLLNKISEMPILEDPIFLSSKKRELLDIYFRVTDNEFLLLNYALSDIKKIKQLYEGIYLDDNDNDDDDDDNDDDDDDDDDINCNKNYEYLINEKSINIKNNKNFNSGFIDIFNCNLINKPIEKVDNTKINKGATSSVNIYKITNKEKNKVNKKLGINIDNLIFEKKYEILDQEKHARVWKKMCEKGGDINNNKSGKDFIYNNETTCLKKLYKKKHFPILLSEDFDNSIIYLNNCGVPLNNENIPIDWKDQIKSIINTLKECNVCNNDMWINNFLVDNDTINLIDFGWGSDKPSFPFLNIGEFDLEKNNDFIELLDAVYSCACELRIKYI